MFGSLKQQSRQRESIAPFCHLERNAIFYFIIIIEKQSHQGFPWSSSDIDIQLCEYLEQYKDIEVVANYGKYII